MTNLFDYDREGLEAYFVDAGHKPFRARQVMKWIFHRNQLDFDAMTDLSRDLRAWLREDANLALPEIVERFESTDGTIKWLVRVGNGNSVETVLIPERGRNTLCVSSQVGCVLDCSFCATGKQGFNGNLSTAEIIGQLLLANAELKARGEAVTNVVLMGMGEPLLNFDAVVRATNLMTDDLAYGISKRRVTISTAGVVPAIYELAKVTDVSLAISLHAPNDALRSELVPINRKYGIAELITACNHYIGNLGEKRTLTMEYTLMKGVNDGLEHARELADLLRHVRCKINLIPFNPFPASGYVRPDVSAVRRFQTVLLNAGFATMLRTTRGEDISAACGQLIGKVQDRTKRQTRYLARVRAEELA
ncbi:MAG: 23S rRNA (adenine(2503)-C(2))-methyltransferase RlmN [Gammaproteobacteria bacterium]|nr:23S rRNA (adenine(2503)-C(2))-methyltransferase RlmN [Gammaproteobacteria bacterium]